MNSPYAGFFSKQIMGSTLFRNYFFDALKSEFGETFGIAIGEAVFDPTGAGTGLGISASADAIGERVLDITGAKWCLTENGDMFEAGNASSIRNYTSGSYSLNYGLPTYFDDVPFNNTNAVTSYVYLGKASLPIDVHVASDGSRGYGVWADVVGFNVVPDSITLSAGKIIVKLDAALTALGMEHWTTAVSGNSRSMFAAVWLNTDTTGVTIHSDDPETAIAFGRLVKDLATGAWKIDLTAIGDGKLGQLTASTTASHYKVAILGPLITTTNTKQGDPDWVFIGTSLSGGGGETVSTAGQMVTVPYATYAAGFAVEHVADSTDPNLGRHKQVTAIEDGDLLLRVDSATDKQVRVTNIGGGQAILVVDDYAQIPEINQNFDFTVDLEDNAFDRYVWFRNSGTQTLTMYVDGTLECTTTTGGSGIIKAKTDFEISGTQLFPTLYDAISIMMAGYHHSTGGGFLAYNNGGGGNVNYVYVDGAIGGIQTILIPIHPPNLYTIKEFRVHHFQSAAGTPNVRVALGRWDEATGAPINITGWQACLTRTGAWAVDSFNLGAGNLLTFGDTQKYYLMIEITNNGIAVNTSRVGRVLLRGTMQKMPYFQQ